MRNEKGQYVKGTIPDNYKGEKVGYVALHEWVYRWKGKANHCERCGATDKKKYHWANVDHKYRRVLEDYISMCVSCHRIYDYERNGYAPKGRAKDRTAR